MQFMSEDIFFEETREQSIVKATMVSKYFDAWSTVIASQVKKRGDNKIAYIDLFAGRGYYEDGTRSTPLLILEKAIKNPDLREMLITIFNDKNNKNVELLRKAIMNLVGIRSLRHEPAIYNEEIGEEIAKELEQTHFIPSLFFIDPYGYKGLSLRLIGALIKDWGCDCIFFFNYNRVNSGLSNPSVKEHMNALFGEERSKGLGEKLKGLAPLDRELTVVEEIAQALKQAGGQFVLPFCFKNDKGNRTSHHLIFVSKHHLGYEIMKGIMAKESSSSLQGIPSFEYSPATTRQSLLYELTYQLDALADMLLNDFSGRCLRMRQIFEEHNIGKRYIIENYKDALRQLEAKGIIVCSPRAKERQKRNGKVTFADSVIVAFPVKRS
jgi:three-Cys-motif partner protein